MTTAASLPTTAGLVPEGIWSVDPVHSSIAFEVKHMLVATFRGEFREYDAALEGRDGRARLTGTARAESVDVRDANLAAHLASPEFFDVARHPEIRFESTALSVDDDGNVTARGELTIKGHTREVEAHGHLIHIAADLRGSERIGLGLETTVDRREFGLEWNAPLPKGGFALANEVTLKVNLELVPQEA